MDFLKEFKKRMKAIDNPQPEIEVIAKPRYDAVPKEKVIKLFNIYKRSLPPGLDQVVVFNVTKEEAEMLLAHISGINKIPLLRSRSYQDDARDTKTVVYYDVIPVGATPKEQSIYFNSPETRKIKDISEDNVWIG